MKSLNANLERIMAGMLAVGLALVPGHLHGQTKASAAPQTGNPHRIPGNSPYAIKSRDANSRVWERNTFERNPSGQWIPHLHRFTEVATGMHYYDSATRQWIESKEEIDPAPGGGAQAVQGQHQVHFPADIYGGLVDILMANGQHVKSRPLGICYYNDTQSVLIAELTNSVGQIISANQVIYTNAFTDFPADILLTYRRSGLECDLVLRSQIPAPEVFGLSSAGCRLELLTEFFDTRDPQEISTSIDPVNGLSDSTLAFGPMMMVRGKAFRIGESQDSAARLPVSKTWTHIDGRTFLIEEVLFRDIQPSLNTLPAFSTAPNTAIVSANSSLHKVSTSRLLPPQRIAQSTTNSLRLARIDSSLKPGVMWDYNIVNNENNYTFQGDTTYYVSGNVNLSGTTTIEGGTVVKYDTNFNCSIHILGTVSCDTAPYRPAVLTSANDSSVGQPVGVGSPGCTGSQTLEVDNYLSDDLHVNIYDDNGYCEVCDDDMAPGSTNFYVISAFYGEQLTFDSFDSGGEFYANFSTTQQNGDMQVYNTYNGEVYSQSGDPLCTPPVVSSTALSLANGGSLHDLLIRYVGTGIESSSNYCVTNLQFLQCQTAAFDTEGASLYAGNVLMSQVGIGFGGQNFNAQSEQLTCDQASNVALDWGGGSSYLAMTNAILTSFGSLGNATIYSDHVAQPSGGVYQSAAGGQYYLADNSPYRNAGTPNISPGLLATLSQKTTYPPIVFSGQTFSTATNFGPQAARDTGLPDYGYLYNPLDYVFSGCIASSNMSFSAGTAVGWFGSAGIAISAQQALTFSGTATQPDYWVRCNAVQEQDTSGVSGTGGITCEADQNGLYSDAPTVSGQFLKSICLGAVENAYSDNGNFLIGQFKNCEFYSCGAGSDVCTYFFTNCLFYRANAGVLQGSSGNQMAFQNCTLWGGNIYLEPTTTLGITVKDCSLDASASVTTANLGNNSSYAIYDYNAYSTTTDPFPIGGTHDYSGVSFNWQTSWFGNFYLPAGSPLIGTGNTNANLLGLYHFTVQTNQVIDGMNLVSIGYHYVATDASGNPLDSNGDGTPDYLEDPLGNGLPYDGTNWALAILTQPTNMTVCSGTNASFKMTADGVPTVTYQWYSNSTAIAGATSSNLIFTNVRTNATGNYFVVVTNNFGSITSSVAALTVVAPPFITQEPSNVMVPEGTNASFKVSASGSPPLNYQWYFGTSALAGATTTNLTLSNVQLTNGGKYFVVVTNNYGAATSAVVTLVDYTNWVNFQTLAGQYYFNYQGSDETLTYEYVPVWPGWTNGTLGELSCTVNGTNVFLPSNRGGLSLIASALVGTNKAEIFPWDPNNIFTLLTAVVNGNSLKTTWQMTYLANGMTGSLTYSYTFQMTNRTLNVQMASTLGNSGGLYLDRCEAVNTPAVAPAIINVPYLTLMNVLYWNGVYCSLYSDWERSAASTNTSLDEMFSGTSDYYAQESLYLQRTSGAYNPVSESVLLTVSPSLSDVLPAVHNPQSTYKTNVANYLVFDNWEAPFVTVNAELQSLATNGLTNLWMIVHNWQYEGYDDGYPDVLPANPGLGGSNKLVTVSQTAKTNSYLFALHENYVDFYPDATNSPGFKWNTSDVALYTNGTRELSWSNQSTQIQSYLMKPTRASKYLTNFASQIHKNYGTTASFLDAHSSLNPSARVDYDSTTTNPGKFVQTLSSWRSLYGLLRTNHNGPVSGEGDNHMLYLGYLDDVEAQIDSGGLGYTNGVTEQWLPLLVDFDLLQLHNLATVHGVGYYERFYADSGNTPQYQVYSNAAVLEYMATELAYGHGGFIPTPSRFSNSNCVPAALLEQNYVFPAQQLYANATAVSILYHDSNTNDEVSASDYIRRYPHDYYTQADPDYMSQVRVTYNNGVVVCVNRHPTNSWQVQVGQAGGWFDYNAMIGTTMVQWTGVTNTTSYTLPPSCGWVVFAPVTQP